MNENYFLDYAKAQPLIDAVVNDDCYTKREEHNQKMRRHIVDVNAMRANNALREHDTYIAVRTIDLNIKNAIPLKLQYLKSNARLLMFSPGDQAELDAEMTRVLKYNQWEIPFIRCFNSSELNGIGYVKVVHDVTKPGHVSIDHVPYGSIFYNRNVENLEHAPLIAEKHIVTSVSFDAYDAFENFDKNTKAYENILAELKQDEQNKKNYSQLQKCVIYEVFFKNSGFVYRGWYYKNGDTWLKRPEKFTNGIVAKRSTFAVTGYEVDEQQTYEPSASVTYPYCAHVLNITDILAHNEIYGRADQDAYLQEAQTQLMTAMVNGAKAASVPMFAPAGRVDSEARAPKQTELKVSPYKIWDAPMQSFGVSYPDPMLMRIMDWVTQQNALEKSQVSWAVNNRRDTRKTASEIQAAGAMQSQLSSEAILTTSLFLTDVYRKAWEIVRSAALQNNIVFLKDNSKREEILTGVYDIRPAGDIDFLEREKKIDNILQDLAIFTNTPISQKLLIEYIKLKYAANAEAWIPLLEGGADKQLIQALLQALGEVAMPNGVLRPDLVPEQQNLLQLKQAAEQYLNSNG
jgi:hypothetical protein